MTRTITKPARDLAVGDVLAQVCGARPRRVVFHVRQTGNLVEPFTREACADISAPYPPERYAADDAVAVEVPEPTPAQVRAGFMVEAIRQARDLLRAESHPAHDAERGKWIEAAGALLAQVEAGGLPTPAQVHAEELADRLQWLLAFVETYASDAIGPATPAINKVRNVLDLVRPPNPPTLREALDALATLADGAQAVNMGEWDSASMQVAREQAHDVVKRARRAKLIP
jgi:hypothetical protein